MSLAESLPKVTLGGVPAAGAGRRPGGHRRDDPPRALEERPPRRGPRTTGPRAVGLGGRPGGADRADQRVHDGEHAAVPPARRGAHDLDDRPHLRRALLAERRRGLQRAGVQDVRHRGPAARGPLRARRRVDDDHQAGWTAAEPFDFDGEYFTVEEVVSQPKPLQQPCAGDHERGDERARPPVRGEPRGHQLRPPPEPRGDAADRGRREGRGPRARRPRRGDLLQRLHRRRRHGGGGLAALPPRDPRAARPQGRRRAHRDVGAAEQGRRGHRRRAADRPHGRGLQRDARSSGRPSRSPSCCSPRRRRRARRPGHLLDDYDEGLATYAEAVRPLLLQAGLRKD